MSAAGCGVFRFHPRWQSMEKELRNAGVTGPGLPALIEMMERRDVELEDYLEHCTCCDGASGPSATLVTAVYTPDDEVALNTIFDVAPFLADDIVLFQGGNDGSTIGAPSAGLTVILQIESGIPKGSGLAWARYGDLDPSDLLGWPGGNQGQNVAIIRNLDPVAPVEDAGYSFYFDDSPVPYGDCNVPANGALLLVVWDYGHLAHDILTTNLSALPSTVLLDGGASLSMYIYRSFDEGNVAPTTGPAYDHVAGGDSWAGCVGMLRST